MLFSKRDLMHIVVPLIVSQTLAVALGIEDSVMVSAAGEAAISGVALVDRINAMLVYLFTSLSAGGSVVISQMMGTGQIKRANHAVKQLVWMVSLAAVVMAGISVGLRGPLLRAIFGSVEADVMRNASAYFLFTAMAYPFLGLFGSCSAIFNAMGRTGTTMLVSLVMNLVNIGGNALFIFGFDLGVTGAALGTLLARFVGAVLLLCLLHNQKNTLYVEDMLHFRFHMPTIRSICRIGIPNGIENSMFELGRLMTQSLIATFGTAQIAANAAAMSVTSLQYIPGGAMGAAIIIMVGRCVGAGEKEQARKYTRRLIGITYGVIIALSVVICLFVNPIVASYHLTGDSGELAKYLIIFHSICVCTIWPMGFTLPNAFRAASDVKFTMRISIFSMWVFRIALSYLLNALFDLGIMCVWYAMIVDWCFRAAVYIIHYLRGSWLKKYHGV